LLAEALAWWAACAGVWLITLSSVTAEELYVAVGGGLPCGVLATAARRSSGQAWAFRPRWLASVAALPATIVGDTGRVFAAAVRRDAGRFAHLDVRDAAGDRPAACARRAAATLLASATPASVVVDVQPETGAATMHLLGLRRSVADRRANG
jgi:multisubunit Na+/H+ antiporter MnhE subunit